jgi:hypothetical protein
MSVVTKRITDSMITVRTSISHVWEYNYCNTSLNNSVK